MYAALQDTTNHAVAVLPQRAVEPYVSTANGTATDSGVGGSGDYSVVAANVYNRGGIMVPSGNARQGERSIILYMHNQ